MSQVAVNQCSSLREEQLRERFGDLLTLKEIAEIFRFPSPEACRKAIARGKLPIQLIRFPNRRGIFSTAKAVANYLDSIDGADSVATTIAGGGNHMT